MLSVSDNFDSVNERSQQISKLMKLQIRGVWQNAHKFIRQLARKTKTERKEKAKKKRKKKKKYLFLINLHFC